MKNLTFQTSTLTLGLAVMLFTPVFLVLLLLSAISGWLLLGGLYLGSWLLLRGFFFPASVELDDKYLITRSGALNQEFVAYGDIQSVQRVHDHFDGFVQILCTKSFWVYLVNKKQEELFCGGYKQGEASGMRAADQRTQL